MSNIQMQPLTLIYGPFTSVPSMIFSNEVSKPIGTVDKNRPIEVHEKKDGKYFFALKTNTLLCYQNEQFQIFCVNKIFLTFIWTFVVKIHWNKNLKPKYEYRNLH